MEGLDFVTLYVALTPSQAEAVLNGLGAMPEESSKRFGLRTRKDQNMRSKRLFHLLQQNFSGYSKIENLIKSQISAVGITESNGFELLRVIRKEFSLLSRSEALGYREQCVKFRVKKTDHLPDVMREVQTEIDSFHSMLEASVIAVELHDVRISEGDQFLLYMRNLPSKVQEFQHPWIDRP